MKLHPFRFVRAANAHNSPGPDGLKMFNIGYLAGIAGLLLAWNTAIMIKVTVSDQAIPYTDLCLKKALESDTLYPLTISVVVISLCDIFSVIITIRTYNKHLSKLQDSHLCNLPSKNALTYIDTLLLFSILSGSFLLKAFFTLSWALDFLPFDAVNLINCIISLIFDDIGVSFIFPIYIIIKTKRYLSKLWDESREIIVRNNDFFSENPATVAPGLQQTDHQIAESVL